MNSHCTSAGPFRWTRLEERIRLNWEGRVVRSKALSLRSRLPCTDPKSGLRPEMGKKWPKNGFRPHREKGGKMAENFWANFLIFRPFFPLVLGGAKLHFSAIFSHFGPGARFGVCTGQSGSQHYLARWSSKSWELYQKAPSQTAPLSSGE